ADNSGGVDLDTISEIRRRRIPVNTIGLGKEELSRDVELDGLDLPAKALASSRLQAEVMIRQNGFRGKQARLILTGGGAVLASRDITLSSGPDQMESIEFNAGKAGVKNIEVKLRPLPREENALNNRVTRVLTVD